MQETLKKKLAEAEELAKDFHEAINQQM